MIPALPSPICAHCARRRGLVPVTEIFTVYEGQCADCGLTATVSAADDWKRPGERRGGWD